jgi:hypothetical protein
LLFRFRLLYSLAGAVAGALPEFCSVSFALLAKWHWQEPAPLFWSSLSDCKVMQFLAFVQEVTMW